MGRDRLFSITIPAPTRGAFPGANPRKLPEDAALRLENLRVDLGIGRSRDGSAELTTVPALTNQGAQTGTITVNNGDTAVTGVGTLFTSEYAVGEYIKVSTHTGDMFTKIATITDNTNMVLVAGGYRGANAAGVAHHRGTFDGNRCVDLFDRSYPDESVETIYCNRLKAYRFLNDAWVEIAGAGNAWTGKDADRFWCLNVPWTSTTRGRLLLCNGVDTIRQWDGTTTDMLNYAGAVPARYAILGDDFRLFVANCFEGGQYKTQLIKWTVVGLVNGNATDWSGTGSGEIDLRQFRYPITGMWKQFGRIYVGLRRGIAVLVPTGIDTNAYGTETLQTNGQGLFAPTSLIQSDNIVAFITHKDFAAFDGTTTQNIGGPMRRELMTRLNFDALTQITTHVDEIHNRVGWGLPLDGSAVPTEIWWYNIDARAWEVDKLQHTCASSFTNVDITTIDELVGTIDSLTGTIDELSKGSLYRSKRIIGKNNGTVKVFDSTYHTDSGAIIEGKYTSGQVNVVGQKVMIAGREHIITKDDQPVVDSIDLALLDRGTNYTLEVELSSDGGATWQSMGQATLTSTSTELSRRIKEVTVYKRVSLRDSIQVRLRNVTTGAPWGWVDITAWIDVVGRKR